MALPREIEQRWRGAVVLKRDVFSTVERGRFLAPERRGRGGAPAHRRRAVVELCARAPSVRARTPRARGRGRARRGAPALARDAAGTGARLDRRRGAPHRQAARRARLFPLGQGGLAQAAPERDLPQRSRQGAELAARQRRARLSDRFPARHALLAQEPPVPHRRLRGSAPPAQAQAPLRAGRAHRRPSAACWRTRA